MQRLDPPHVWGGGSRCSRLAVRKADSSGGPGSENQIRKNACRSDWRVGFGRGFDSRRLHHHPMEESPQKTARGFLQSTPHVPSLQAGSPGSRSGPAEPRSRRRRRRVSCMLPTRPRRPLRPRPRCRLDAAAGKSRKGLSAGRLAADERSGPGRARLLDF